MHESVVRARAEQEAPQFERQVTEAVRESRNERELQTRVNARLTAFAASVGADLVLREEYTVVAGRADAVYNRLIIEYEAPGSLRLDLGHGRTAHAVKQAKDYIEGVARRDHFAKDRLLGVAFDGEILIFVRFREGKWIVDPPLTWSRTTASRLLRSVVALSAGRALTPENLVEDFGAQSPISQLATRALYARVPGGAGSLTEAMYRQWGVFFSEVSGYSETETPLGGKPALQLFAKGMGLDPARTDPPRLLFAIHTYFSFLAKTIARLIIERYAGGGLGASPLTVVATLDGEPLRNELRRLEAGGIFKTLGFTNLLEGDFFSWYVDDWTPEIADVLHQALERLADYNPATVEEDPFAARDLLKKLYHRLLPRDLRHDLGEYYTPDWLATRVLRQLGEPLYVMPDAARTPKVEFSKRLLDPACGSGTFPILAITRIPQLDLTRVSMGADPG